MTTTTLYTTRVGAPRSTRARTYTELLDLGSEAEERPDDGALAGPWITTPSSGWSWNEGPCPCGGVMRWAEAGYVPWHRICDRCGSHWELHPMRLIPHEARPERIVPVAWRLPGGRVVFDLDEVALAGLDEDQVPVAETVRIPGEPRGVLPIEPRPHPGAGEVRVDPETGEAAAQLVDPERVPLYRQARALVRPEHITDQALRHGALWAGWARRARFY